MVESLLLGRPLLACREGDISLKYHSCVRNWADRIPPGVLTSLPEGIEGIGKIERMRLPRESIIPGHNPHLMTSFPVVAEDVVKIA